MKNALRRALASTLMVSCTLMGMPMSAQAGIVATETLSQEAGAAQAGSVARARVDAFLARDDVRLALVGQGLDLEQAQARVNALSDAEVAELAGRIDSAPAGGEVLGLLFSVFVILLVTDILGFTKVFPFTRSVR